MIDFICHYRTKSLLGDPEKPLLERKKLLRYQFNIVIMMNYRINFNFTTRIYWFLNHMSNNWYFSEGKALAELAFNNRSLRDALLATTESVAVGIHVENWSTYRLWQPEYEMEKGRTYSEEAAKLAGTLPGTVSFFT